MDRDEERRIIAQVCAGDTNAFEALVVAYQKQVYNLALRTVGNEEDAADMTQEVFLRAYRALGSREISRTILSIASHSASSCITC